MWQEIHSATANTRVVERRRLGRLLILGFVRISRPASGRARLAAHVRGSAAGNAGTFALAKPAADPRSRRLPAENGARRGASSLHSDPAYGFHRHPAPHPERKARNPAVIPTYCISRKSPSHSACRINRACSGSRRANLRLRLRVEAYGIGVYNRFQGVGIENMKFQLNGINACDTVFFK